MSDLLSPPGQRDQRKSLGAYDLAGDKTPFFELRDFMTINREQKPEQIHQKVLHLLEIEETLRQESDNKNLQSFT